MKNSILRMTLVTLVLGIAASGTLMSATLLTSSDGVIRNSLCVGFDCPSAPSFGSDTIRLQENNLRIHFEDTSVGSFPSGDWRLTANDSSSGGLSHFSIDDASAGRTVFRVEAGARSNALYVEADGDVGIGTANPVVDVHIVTGNTPTIRLDQDGTSGFTSQVWDLAGNEANFFIRDVTGGSKLPFRIQPNAPNNSLFVTSTGKIGLGTASPAEALHLNQASGAGSVRLLTQSSDNGAVQWLMKTDSANRRFVAQNTAGANQAQIVFGDNGAFQFLGPTGADVRMNIDAAGNVTIQGNCADGNGAGGGTDGCDFVFDPAYQLESIEDHAASMWQNSHLPAIGPTPEGKTVSLSLQQRHFGMLNELEKAHIYIERLNERLKGKEVEVEQLGALMQQKDAQMKQILERLEKVETALQ